MLMPGDSFFVPCLDTDRIMLEVTALAEAMEIRVRMRAEIKDGFYGLRVWRLP